MKLFRIIVWEFVQNLLFIASFIAALEFWQKDKLLLAIVCVTLGNVVGALFVRATEQELVAGFEEPWSTVLLNSVAFSAASLLVVVYSSASYGNWETDVVLGVALGVVIGVAQSLSTYRRVVVVHCIALICALPLILVSLRILVALPPVTSTLLLTLVATLAMSLIDYGPFGRSEG